MEHGRIEHYKPTERDLFFSSLLMDEIDNENIDKVKRLLLQKNADPNLVLPNRGIAAMHVLAGLENEYFSIEVLEIALKERNGDPNVRSDDGLTPVHLAAIWGRCSVLEVLLKFGGNPLLQEYKLSLNAEDLALKEHQWQTHAILATFSVLNDDNEHENYFFNDVGSTSEFNFDYGLSNKVTSPGKDSTNNEINVSDNNNSLIRKFGQGMDSETSSHISPRSMYEESIQMHDGGMSMNNKDKLQRKKKFSDQFGESISKLKNFFRRASFSKFNTNNSPTAVSKRKPSKMSL